MHRILTGLVGVCTSVALAVVAAADPAPPPDVPPPLDPFAAASEQTSSDQVGTLAALLAGPSGASPADVLNQGVGLTAPPPVDPLAAAGLLYPQYYRMPDGEDASPYVLQTDVPPGPFARVDAFKGVHALIHGGLGRMPGGELGQALPGTAAPADANLPPGLEQFYIAPEAILVPPVQAPAG